MDNPIFVIIDFYNFAKETLGENEIRKMLEKTNFFNCLINDVNSCNFVEILRICLYSDKMYLFYDFLDSRKINLKIYLENEKFVQCLLDICFRTFDLKLFYFFNSQINIDNFRKLIAEKIRSTITNNTHVFGSIRNYQHPCINEFFIFLFFHLHFINDFFKSYTNYTYLGGVEYYLNFFITFLFRHYYKKTYETSIFGFLYGGFNSKFVGKLSVENFNNTLDLL
jgi:hypothetical protein